MVTKNKYDVIIIGSGIGGLVVASLLSKQKKVLVIEKNNTFGGYCASFKRNNFNFEIAIQAINGIGRKGTIRDILKRSKAYDRVNFLMPMTLYRTIFPDYDLTIPQKDLIGYKKMLSTLFPREEKNITKLFSVMRSIYLEMNQFHQFYREFALKKSPFTLQYYKKSFKELMEEFIADTRLQAIISQYWIYRGLPPSRLSSVIFSYIWYDYTANGSYYPEGGMSILVTNLIRNIKQHGGEVLCNHEAFRIYLEDGRVAALELKTGELLQADDFVSNIDFLTTVNMIKVNNRKFMQPFIKRLKQNILSISAFKIYLGLTVDVKKLGITDYEIFVNPLYDLDQSYEACLNGEVEKMPYSITIYSNLTKGACPKGSSVVSIGMLSGYDFWKRLSKEDYKTKKNEMMNIMISRCEKVIPDLRKYIKTKVAATPLTMKRYTGNSEGSAYGWNKKILKEEIRFMNPTTPISNLMLSSQWTKIGGGVAGVLLSSDRVCSLLNKT